MTMEQPDPLLRLLAGLPTPSPPSELDRRVLSRGRAALARQQRRRSQISSARQLRARILDTVLAAAIASYGAIAVVEAVRLVVMR